MVYSELSGRAEYHNTPIAFPCKPIDYVDGVLYGTRNSKIYSLNNSGIWDYACDAPSSVSPLRFLLAGDGEVLLGASGGVYKSTGWGTSIVSWAQELDISNGTAYMLEWGLDGDNASGKFIATHYDGESRENSRYAWISTDYGDSWSQVWDSETDAPSAAPTDSHLHGVCYDPYDDVFYLSEGHGDSVGIYSSSDDGSTWVAVTDNGLCGTSAPTAIAAGINGIVFGSDNSTQGIYVLERGSEADGMVVAYNHGTVEFVWAQRAVRDEATGTVYVGFESDTSGVPAIIAASDGATAGLIWTDTSDLLQYSSISAHNGSVCGYNDTENTNIFFNFNLYTPNGNNMTAHINLPGGSLTYADTAQVNLLPGDTAHVQNSRGNWTNVGSGTVDASPSADSGASFGDNVLYAQPDAAATSYYIRQPLSTSAVPVTASSGYAASVRAKFNRDGYDVRCVIVWIDSGGNYLTQANGTSQSSVSGDWVTLSASGTAPGSAAYASVQYQILTGDAFGSGAEVGIDVACLRSGGDGTFIPSLRLEGDIEIECVVAADDWTSGSTQSLISNYQNYEGFWFYISPTGNLGLYRGDGSAANAKTSTAAMTNNSAQFYNIKVVQGIDSETIFSVDGAQLGDAVSTSISPVGTTLDTAIGSNAAGSSLFFGGGIKWLKVRDGVGGPDALDFDIENAFSANGPKLIDGDTWADGSGRTYTANMGVSSLVIYSELHRMDADALFGWILSNESLAVTDTEIVGALNELNGTNGVEYAQARATYLGIDPAG